MRIFVVVAMILAVLIRTGVPRTPETGSPIDRDKVLLVVSEKPCESKRKVIRPEIRIDE